MKYHYFTEFDKVDDNIYRRWLDRVPEFRRYLALSFKHRRDALLSLASYLLLERNLSSRHPTFYYNEFGKPYLTPLLAKGPPPFFNLSHTNGMAVCGTANTEIGIDVERIANLDHQLTETICTDQERRFLECCDDTNYQLARLWVLKESFFKFLGCGLSCDPQSVDVSGLSPHGFVFETFSDIPGYVAAACRHGNGTGNRWCCVTLEELEHEIA